jgi:4'-phosphopantetheinyl transferase
MEWQAVPFAELARTRALPRDELHVWWWPEPLQPTAPSRRQRTDLVLRHLLAPYLRLPPDALRFGREPKGRPYLLHADAPDFNFSDTRGGSVLALSASGRVGIDIERGDRSPPVLAIAERWFAPDESAALRSLEQHDADAARRAFLRLWTAKEASCKATGTGIYSWLPAWRFAIEDEAPVPIALPVDAGDTSRWTFRRLAPADTHTVALACRDAAQAPRGFSLVE